MSGDLGIKRIGNWRGYRIYENRETGMFHIRPMDIDTKDELYNPEELFLSKGFARIKIDEINGKLPQGELQRRMKKWDMEKEEEEERARRKANEPEKPWQHLYNVNNGSAASSTESETGPNIPINEPEKCYCISVRLKDQSEERFFDFQSLKSCLEEFERAMETLSQKRTKWIKVGSLICRRKNVLEIEMMEGGGR